MHVGDMYVVVFEEGGRKLSSSVFVQICFSKPLLCGTSFCNVVVFTGSD